MLQHHRSLCLVLSLATYLSWGPFLVSPSSLLPFDLLALRAAFLVLVFLLFFFFPVRDSFSRCYSPTYVVSPDHLMVRSCTSASQGTGARTRRGLPFSEREAKKEREGDRIYRSKDQRKHKLSEYINPSSQFPRAHNASPAQSLFKRRKAESVLRVVPPSSSRQTHPSTRMITYPSVTTVAVESTVAGTPFLRKSDELRYRLPVRTKDRNEGQFSPRGQRKSRGTYRENPAER